jgi:thiol-disulfide isomerase/thioredoxin
MALRARTIVRICLLAGLAAIALAAFVRPFREEPPRRAPRPAALPEPPRFAEHKTPEGLIATDAASLLARVRRSRAKGIVINAWASWCGSCKEDVPLLLGLPKVFGADIEVLLVSVDEPSSEPEAAEMLRGFNAPAPAFVVDQPLDAFKAAINPRWPGMLPATFLFDPAGKLHYFWGGPVLEGEIVPLLRRYLAGEHIDGEADFALAPGAITR